MHIEKTSFLFLLLLITILIGILHILGIYFFLYWKFLWFDIVVHLLGGIFVGGIVLWICYLSGLFKEYKIKKNHVFLISLIAVLIIGLFWEFFEFKIGATLLADTNTYRIDTAIDIISDGLGGVIIAIYFINKNYLQN